MKWKSLLLKMTKVRKKAELSPLKVLLINLIYIWWHKFVNMRWKIKVQTFFHAGERWRRWNPSKHWHKELIQVEAWSTCPKNGRNVHKKRKKSRITRPVSTLYVISHRRQFLILFISKWYLKKLCVLYYRTKSKIKSVSTNLEKAKKENNEKEIKALESSLKDLKVQVQSLSSH